MPKKLIAIITAILLIINLAACGAGGATSGNANKAASGAGSKSEQSGPIGSGVIQFDPNKKINNGKDIELEYWFWFGEDIFQQVIDNYAKHRPNVKITLANQPWSEMWTKLPLALNSETGPPLFNVHNSQHANLAEYMDPLGISVEDLDTDFINVKAHLDKGNIYYIDFGMMTSAIYYNKDHWEEAGLSETDIPKTWDQLIEIAVKLTKFQDDKMVQSGFNVNGSSVFITALNYQQGRLMFRDDKKTADFDTPVTQQNFQMIKDLYNTYRVCDRDFGIDSGESFGIGQSSMVYSWGWYNGHLISTYPDLNFGIFEMPTFDGNVPFAIDRTNGESTPGVNKNASKAHKEAAQDFLLYFLASDDDLLSLDLFFDVFPSKRNLASNPKVLEKPALQILAKNITRYIWPGPYPATYDTALNVVLQNIIYNDMPIKEAVAEGQRQMDLELPPIGFVSVESEYAHFSEHK